MSKPIEQITFTTLEDKSVSVEALFDSGSYYTIIREDVLPAGTQILQYKAPQSFGTAGN